MLIHPDSPHLVISVFPFGQSRYLTFPPQSSTSTFAMPVCAGCNIEFIGKGYTLHLKLTTNPLCMAIFERADGQGTQAQDHEYFGSPAYHGLPSGKFAGDFFGADYAPEDFGYILEDEDDSPAGSGSEKSDDDSDDEDFDEQERTDLGTGYEPLRPTPTAQGDVPMPGTEPQINLTALTRETRKAAEDRFHHKPIIEKYPGRLAGKPISTVRAQTAEQAYTSSLVDSTTSNPYAPFNSKTDWEVARWAKLRGSGSTAFSDLLNVEGVG